jgi:deoxyribonuclease-4
MLFGAHVSTAGGIDSGIDRIHDLGGTCVQVFTQSPRMWKPTAHKPESIARFKERRAECGIGDVVCHALYLVNLASPNDEFYDKSIVAMGASMDAAVAIEAEGVIFHVGSHMGAGFEAGLERVVPAMRQVLEQTTDRTWLLMENSAGAGGTIGRDLDELVAIWEALDRHPRLGICLDTCHLFVSGVDVGDPAVLQATLDDLDARMGLDRLRCLHVNDSKAPLGSNKDRHDNLFDGLIGERLATVLGHPQLQHLPAVLETPGHEGKGGPDLEEMARFARLHALGLAQYGSAAA